MGERPAEGREHAPAARPPDLFDRRTVFRIGAAAAATVAAGIVFVPGTRIALAAPASAGKPAREGNFRVRVGDVELRSARRVRFGAVSAAVRLDVGSPPTIHFLGLAPSTTIEIVVAADEERVLADWYLSVKGGSREDVRTVTVELLAANGRDVIRSVRARGSIVESFAALLGSARSVAEDFYVVRCPLGDGNFLFEEP